MTVGKYPSVHIDRIVIDDARPITLVTVYNHHHRIRPWSLRCPRIQLDDKNEYGPLLRQKLPRGPTRQSGVTAHDVAVVNGWGIELVDAISLKYVLLI